MTYGAEAGKITKKTVTIVVGTLWDKLRVEDVRIRLDIGFLTLVIRTKYMY